MIKFIILFMSLVSISYASDPIRIAIVDTGLDLTDPRFKDVLCSHWHLDLTGTGIKDKHGHGTHVAGLIKEYAGIGNYCFIIVKYYDEKDLVNSTTNQIEALKYLSRINVDFINLSTTGTQEDFIEFTIIRDMRAILITAAGNDGVNLRKHPHYPCNYDLPNVICVGNTNSANSDFGLHKLVWEYGTDIDSTLPKGHGKLSGTSMSTAIRCGKMIKERLKNDF